MKHEIYEITSNTEISFQHTQRVFMSLVDAGQRVIQVFYKNEHFIKYQS